MLRETWAEVDLDRLAHNVRVLRGLLAPGTKLMASVKADAYGHGAVPVSRTALAAGADKLGVATVGEAQELREAGIEADILVYGALTGDGAAALAAIGGTATIASADDVACYDGACRRAGIRGRVHVKLDTGMGRLGFRDPNEAVRAMQAVASSRNLELEGVYTHFSSADEAPGADPESDYTERQRRRFEGIIARARASGLEWPEVHAANSAALLRGQKYHYDRVRPGIALYGYQPDSSSDSSGVPLKPAMSVYARITRVETIEPGEGVSYGHTFVAQRPERVATVAIGYGDGIPRALSNRGLVRVNGECRPIVGRVCMDQLMIRVTGIDASPGDVVTLYGDSSDETEPACASVEGAAEICGTISYELLCRIARRVPRIYRGLDARK